jgi:hypothetical protein
MLHMSHPSRGALTMFAFGFLPRAAAGEPNSVPDTKTGAGTPAMDPYTGAPGPDVGKAAATVSDAVRGE